MQEGEIIEVEEVEFNEELFQKNLKENNFIDEDGRGEDDDNN